MIVRKCPESAGKLICYARVYVCVTHVHVLTQGLVAEPISALGVTSNHSWCHT